MEMINGYTGCCLNNLCLIDYDAVNGGRTHVRKDTQVRYPVLTSRNHNVTIEGLGLLIPDRRGS